MKIILLCRDPELVAAAAEAYEFTDELETYSDWEPALDASAGCELLIVDLLATLEEENKIEGYEKFGLAKMGHPLAKDVPVVLIAPPDDYELEYMVGWPNFLHGMVRRPVTMKIFRRISTWV
jgi:hypothetical protein